MIKRIQVGKNKRVLETDKIEIDGLAVRNDNDVDVLRFEFDEFVDGQATMLTDIRGEDGLLAPFILEKNSEDKFYEIRVTKELLVNPILTIQLQIVDGEKVWHSKQACLLVHNSLNIGEGKMPSGIDNWLEQAGNKLNEADQKIQEIEKTIKEFKEKDPTIPQHVKNITEEQISNWDEGGNVDLSDYYTKEEIDNKGYITELPEIEVEQKQADWSQNDETAPDYIKNRPFYEGATVTNIINPAKTCTFTYYQDNDAFADYKYTYTEEEQTIINSLVDGSGVVRITINGNTFESKSITISNKKFYSGTVNLGTALDSSADDSNFLFAEISQEKISISNANLDLGSFDFDISLSIVASGEVVKIDKKYLPDTVVFEDELVQSDWNQNDESSPSYIKNRPFYDNESLVTIFENTAMELAENDATNHRYTYDWTDDEINNFITTYIDTKGDWSNRYKNFKNYKFKIECNGVIYELTEASMWIPEEQTFFKAVTEFGEIELMAPDRVGVSGKTVVIFNSADVVQNPISIKLYEIGGIPVRIPEKYLPDTIATKKYVDEKFNSIVNGDEVSY